MKIKENLKDYDGAAAWDHIVEYVIAHGEVTTMKGITFSAKFVGHCIFLKGGVPGTKRYEKGEYLTGKDFIYAYDIVKDWNNINTGNVKPHIKRQQTPFIALLHCSGILE